MSEDIVSNKLRIKIFDDEKNTWGEWGALLVAAGYINAPEPEQQVWRSPVDDPFTWYCAIWHDPTGKKNTGGYKHTGIDLNLDRAPYGDVERGFPVFSISDGVVVSAEYSRGWLDVVVIEHNYNGAPLYVRYAHLTGLDVRNGEHVKAGTKLGAIGNWTGGDGGDHLHLDVSTKPFRWSVWDPTNGDKQGFIDPVPVLRDVLGDDVTDGLLYKNNG